MSTIGVNFQIDQDKLDELRFHIGKKGRYANLVLFLNSEPDKYGQNGGIKQADTKKNGTLGLRCRLLATLKYSGVTTQISNRSGLNQLKNQLKSQQPTSLMTQSHFKFHVKQEKKMVSNSNTNYTGDDYRILFKMTEEGKSTVEIAKVLKRDLKGIYNIRSKIRKQLSVKASRRIEKVDQKPKPVLKRKNVKASYPPFPKTGLVKLAQIIGDPTTVPPTLPMIPISPSSWYKGCSEGRYPKPVKFEDHQKASSFWRAEDIHNLIDDMASKKDIDDESSLKDVMNEQEWVPFWKRLFK